MYCTVYTNGNGSVIYINPNCNMKLIYEYLRVVAEVPDSSKDDDLYCCIEQEEIDLCTESGRLLGIYEAPCSASGLQYFKPRSNYFVLTFDYEEGSGELYNPQSLMHYTNRDFESVFAKIKKTFGIPNSEPIDDSDALLIFEHLLQAYQENPQLFSDSTSEKGSSPSKRPDTKRRKSRSSTSLAKQARSSKQLTESSVLAQWREEKKIKMATQRMEESEAYMMMKRGSSAMRPSISILNDYREDHEWEEADPEEKPAVLPDTSKSKDNQNGVHHATGKKGSKKQHKKAGKDAKEEAKLLQAAALSKSGELPASNPGKKRQQAESVLQLHPSAAKSGDGLKTIFFSRSSLFAKSDVRESVEPNLSQPIGSIRQFFRDHPSDILGLPEPPAADSSLNVRSKGTAKVKKSKKLLAALKRKKVVVSRRSHAGVTCKVHQRK